MFADQINDAARANDAIAKKQDIAASRVARNNALFRLLDQLPEEFSRDDLKKAAAAVGAQESTARTYLHRLLQREMIMETKDGYKKLL